MTELPKYIWAATLTNPAATATGTWLSIMNDSASDVLRILHITISVAQGTAASSIPYEWRVGRITGHTAGTAVGTVQKYDTNDPAAPTLTAYHRPASTTGAVNLDITPWWHQNLAAITDIEGHQSHGRHSLYTCPPGTKPIIIRPGEGLRIADNYSNSIAANLRFDIIFEVGEDPMSALQDAIDLLNDTMVEIRDNLDTINDSVVAMSAQERVTTVVDEETGITIQHQTVGP